jgi:alkylated DNA repair dioxygenase AlkB
LTRRWVWFRYLKVLITPWWLSNSAEVDLFAANGLQRLPVPDAEVYYLSQLDLPASNQELLQRLLEDVPWVEQEIFVWGKTHLQPRLVAWYGDDQARYTYSGIELEPRPWSPLLAAIKDRVELAATARFNSVLLNYYRNHRDSMGFHSDDEPELGKQPVIGSVTLGEERSFVMKHKRDRSLAPVRLKLASGSLLVMKGDTQANWRHGINKLQSSCGARVNMTFRYILRPAYKR